MHTPGLTRTNITNWVDLFWYFVLWMIVSSKNWSKNGWQYQSSSSGEQVCSPVQARTSCLAQSSVSVIWPETGRCFVDSIWSGFSGWASKRRRRKEKKNCKNGEEDDKKARKNTTVLATTSVTFATTATAANHRILTSWFPAICDSYMNRY